MSVINGGGEDVNAIVVDIGSGTSRVGYSGEELPRAVFPSLAGYINQDNENPQETKKSKKMKKSTSPKKSQTYVGYPSLNIRRDNMEVVSPCAENSTYENFDVLQKLLNYAFYDRLKLTIEDHPLLICEPTNYQDSASREDLVTMAFENYNIPAVFLCKNAVLSSFATGRSSSLIVDMGYSGTTISAVHDGYLLYRSVIGSPIGGACMTECLKATIDPNGELIKPRYSFRRVEDAHGNLKTEYLDFPNITKSYQDYCINTIVSDIKESVCRISDSVFLEDEGSNIPTVSYELPDGNEIHVGSDRFKVPEILFQPELISTFKGVEMVEMDDGSPVKNVSRLVIDSINSCDVDIRKELYSGVVLTGGSSLFNQMRERLEKEIASSGLYASKVKVISPANANERKFGVFIGGSILSSLATFQQMWMSHAEYKEHGPSLIHRRSP